jgi:putative oxidoreductase
MLSPDTTQMDKLVAPSHDSRTQFAGAIDLQRGVRPTPPQGQHERTVLMQAPRAITVVTDLAERIAHAFGWLPPALARLTVGLVFFQSGWGKLHSLEKVTDYFTGLGIPAPYFQARLASTSEFVCGALLLVGLATRFATIPLIVTMCVAIRTALWDQVDGIGSLVGLTEFAYIALLVWLAVEGAGPLSLDALLSRLTRGEDRSLPGTSPSRATF